MPTPDDTEQTWLIEQFLRGNLPAEVHQRLEQRLDTDPIFFQQVMAQWLVLNYLDEQREVAAFYRDWDTIVVTSGMRKTYESHKGIRYLPQLLGLAAFVVLCLSFAFWGLMQPPRPHPQLTTLPIEPDETSQYGFSDSEESVVVVRYSRLPAFWSNDKKYTWKADTLTVYGLSPLASPTESWHIRPTPERTVYQLETDRKTYRIRKNQRTLTPLLPDENP